MSIFLILFLAGMLTILLPCILPLLPIVLGVSIAGRSPWRPLVTIGGMLLSFVGFTFLLLTVLQQFVALADLIRIATYYALLLFGFGFAFHNRWVRIAGAVLGAAFFWERGITTVLAAAVLGVIATLAGGWVATRLQQFGTDAQAKAGAEFGRDSPVTAFVIGLTLGLVWVPCAGPALSFAFALVRDEPGLKALLALLAYGLGTAVPLLAVGYGGQAAVKGVRGLSKYTGTVKAVSGVLLILTALGLQFRLFEKFQILLLDHTNFGDIGTRIEESLFEDDDTEPSSPSAMDLPKLSRAPELAKTGEWFNGEPFTLESLRGKVVLVDFWTYSCINCIRTLPYVQGYWDTYKDTGKFVLLGVHTPEFVFEKDAGNVRDAIKRHKLTYPVVQDNDFGTWQAFANRYWPAKYLIDADGYIRYEHFGEGDYEETDKAIAALLAEAGVQTGTGMTVGKEEATAAPKGPQSPETYLGSRSWPALGNAKGAPKAGTVTYDVPSETLLHKYYLAGEWELTGGGERQLLKTPGGEILMRFLGGEANLVMGLENGDAGSDADIYIDGTLTKTITIDHQDLYNIYDGPYGEHELRIVIKNPGVAAYAFTFGQGK